MSMKFRTVVFLKPYFMKIYLRNISHSKDVTIIPCLDGIYYVLMNDILLLIIYGRTQLVKVPISENPSVLVDWSKVLYLMHDKTLY